MECLIFPRIVAAGAVGAAGATTALALLALSTDCVELDRCVGDQDLLFQELSVVVGDWESGAELVLLMTGLRNLFTLSRVVASLRRDTRFSGSFSLKG